MAGVSNLWEDCHRWYKEATSGVDRQRFNCFLRGLSVLYDK